MKCHLEEATTRYEVRDAASTMYRIKRDRVLKDKLKGSHMMQHRTYIEQLTSHAKSKLPPTS
jgi:hypothetical protein